MENPSVTPVTEAIANGKMEIGESALKPALQERNYDPNFETFLKSVDYRKTPRDSSSHFIIIKIAWII